GKKAGLIGFIAVCIFMVWSYGVLGLFANIALSLALLYILALLSLFQATLTLPGIAGIILTMGMAVDANVLIYERIKEELHKGVSNLYAIRTGFESAFATILDSNLTTLIVFTLLLLILIVIIALMQIFMPQLMLFIAPGFHGKKEQFELTVFLCRITIPYLIFISLTALLGGILNSVKKFAAFAFSP
ncbi:unnamed protein product, partial [Ixodes persulcatus]